MEEFECSEDWKGRIKIASVVVLLKVHVTCDRVDIAVVGREITAVTMHHRHGVGAGRGDCKTFEAFAVEWSSHGVVSEAAAEVFTLYDAITSS